MSRKKRRQQHQQRKGRGSRAKRTSRPRPHGRKTFSGRQDFFLASWFWKVLHRAAPGYDAVRWKIKPLLMVALLMLFSSARTEKGRFEESVDWWNRMRPNRKRPGKTKKGFADALGRLPRSALKAGKVVMRDRIAAAPAPRWRFGRWIPFGVDGSRLELPRQPLLEKKFGTSGTGATPQLWVTALVHLSTGIPWSWRFGRSKTGERSLALDLFDTLPADAMVVGDAGFTGYEFLRRLGADGKRAFLIRLSSGCHLYADFQVSDTFTEGHAWLWPTDFRDQDPMRLRTIRLPGKKGKEDVWLATNVMESTELSRQTASEIFRSRWEHEVFYRSYKRTLDQAKLSSRSVKQAIREVEIAMLGTQLLLAQTEWALMRHGTPRKASPAAAVLQLAREMREQLKGKKGTGYLGRLAKAAREDRPNRTSAKTTRDWPSKTKKASPRPPKIHPLNEELKAKIEQTLGHQTAV